MSEACGRSPAVSRAVDAARHRGVRPAGRPDPLDGPADPADPRGARSRGRRGEGGGPGPHGRRRGAAQIKTTEKPRKDPAVRRSRHNDPGEIERVKQLYEEIDSLTRIRDQVEERLSGERWTVTRKVAPGKTPAAPARKP